jgi:hypothetical protein
MYRCNDRIPFLGSTVRCDAKSGIIKSAVNNRKLFSSSLLNKFVEAFLFAGRAPVCELFSFRGRAQNNIVFVWYCLFLYLIYAFVLFMCIHCRFHVAA